MDPEVPPQTDRPNKRKQPDEDSRYPIRKSSRRRKGKGPVATDAFSLSSSSSSSSTATNTPRDTSKYLGVNMTLFTCAHLHAVCRSNSWEGHSALRKADLMRFVEEKLRTSGFALIDHKRQWVCKPPARINQQDPITLEDLSRRPRPYLFCIKSGSEQIQVFCPISCVENILRSGQTCNVLTRQPLTSEQLLDLEHRYASCLRAHAGTPPTRAEILSLRPDMDQAQLAVPPNRHDLQLEEGRPLPGPVFGFAPWLTSKTLQQRAAEVFREEQERRDRSETLALLTEELVTLLNSIGLMCERYSERQLEVMPRGVRESIFGLVVYDTTPRMQTLWGSIYDLSPADAMELLGKIHRRAIDAQNALRGHNTLAVSCWRWHLALMLKCARTEGSELMTRYMASEVGASRYQEQVERMRVVSQYCVQWGLSRLIAQELAAQLYETEMLLRVVPLPEAAAAAAGGPPPAAAAAPPLVVVAPAPPPAAS